MYKQKRRFDERFISHLVHSVDILALLESYSIPVKKRGKSYLTKCFVHDDRTPSMAVNPETGRYHCFGCGAKGTVVSFLMDYARLDYVKAIQELAARSGMSVVYESGEVANTPLITKPLVRRSPATKILEPFAPVVPEYAMKPTLRHPELGKPSVVYWYTDAYGVARWDAVGERRKEFRPFHFSPLERCWKFGDPKDCLLPLYKIDALQAGQKIIVCEGEKAADAAACYFPSGLCTTTAHGSKSPYRSDFEPVGGHEVFIFPDNDLPGWLYACEVAELCCKAGASMVKIVYWECREVPPKWDLADPLLEGWPKEKLVRSVKVLEWY